MNAMSHADGHPPGPAQLIDAGPDVPIRPGTPRGERMTGERILNGRTLDQRRQQRRQALLAAALDLFGTKGYASTSVEEICRLAHVSTRNFYEEYANREVLLKALGEQVLERVYRAITESNPEPGPGLARRGARERAAAVVHALVDDPRVARVAFVETMGVSPELQAQRQAGYRLYAHWLVEYVADDLAALGIDQRHREALGLALVGATNELILNWVVSDERPPVEELIDLIVDLAMILLHRPADPASD